MRLMFTLELRLPVERGTGTFCETVGGTMLSSGRLGPEPDTGKSIGYAPWFGCTQNLAVENS